MINLNMEVIGVCDCLVLWVKCIVKSIKLGSERLEWVNSFKYLGVNFEGVMFVREMK